jgi:hypothetical protein
MPTIVIVNRHEPEGDVAQRLLELATEKGHDARTVEAVRGEHDATLSFRVPEDVAEAFNADRGDRWPSKLEGEEGSDRPVAALNEDAFEADARRAAMDVAAANTEEAAADEDTDTSPARRRRRGNAEQE